MSLTPGYGETPLPKDETAALLPAATDIADAVEIILPAVPATNPQPVTTGNMTELLHAELAGEDPAAMRQP